VGRYVVSNRAPPSVLVQRQSGPYTWGQIRPEGRVSSGSFLVSLPGYRSEAYLDSGAYLMLWGNVPEFSNFPPVLESTVMLHVPAPGIDLDFTLDHGRVLLANSKPQGEAHVRVRFRQEVWDLTLPDPRTQVVLELWGFYPRDVPFNKDGTGRGPTAQLDLYVQGKAHLKTRTREYDLANLAQFGWTNAGPEPAGPKTLPKVPDWWTNKIDPKTASDAVAGVMLDLKDFSVTLSKTDAVMDAVVTLVRESPAGANRPLGVLFLGALDAVPYLVEALEDRVHPEVRGTAAFVLRNWISRSRDNELELYRTLYEKSSYSRENAEIVMQLLHGFSEADVSRPETYQRLIGYLNHDKLAIRSLAFWHLALLAPEGARQIAYDPAADPDKRKQAVDQWKRFIPEGKVPPRPPAR
jgi:hypothetical protein